MTEPLSEHELEKLKENFNDEVASLKDKGINLFTIHLYNVLTMNKDILGIRFIEYVNKDEINNFEGFHIILNDNKEFLLEIKE